MFYEKVLLPGGVLDIELRDDMTYFLRYGSLIEYSNGRRRVRGRLLPYQFRSVEQLRYDFEQDLAEVA
jgi:hypothetical protein